MKTIILFIFLAFCTFSCKKDIQPNISPTLALLQHTWTPTYASIIFPNGDTFKLIHATSVIFYSNGQVVYKAVLSNTPSNIQYVTEGYKLLPDDSTIIFSQLVNGRYVVGGGDTSIIKTLTNHLLVYNIKLGNFIAGVDSLER